MNILFLMLAFPDMDTSSNMYTDLVEEFALRGHKVFVAAPAQKERDSGLKLEKGVPVLRVKTLPLFNVGAIKKGIANVLLPYFYYKAIKKTFKDHTFDLVVPITLGRIAQRMKVKYKAPFYLILRDIFPQNAVDLGMMRNSGILYRYFRNMEKQLYRSADYIGCMSQGNVEYVLRHNSYLQREKLHILRNFEKKEKMDPAPSGAIRKKYGIEDKFVVIFGGNMGLPQQLENVIKLAKKCEEYEDVLFLLVGKGAQRKAIEELAYKWKVKNVRFQDYVPREDYQQLVASCQIGLISLNERFTIPNIPSKVMSYFAVGIPVLASIDRNTDFGDILRKHGLGLVSYADDEEMFKMNFDTLYRQSRLREEMGKKGMDYFDKFMSPGTAYTAIMSAIVNKDYEKV